MLAGIVLGAVVPASTLQLDAGCAGPAAAAVLAVIVAHDAHGRGLTILWGILSLTIIGFLVYVTVIRRNNDRQRSS